MNDRLTTDPTDPVHKHEDGKWYFWDETWSDEIGPFADEDEARRQLELYCETL